jgi:hypothetical protein
VRPVAGRPFGTLPLLDLLQGIERLDPHIRIAAAGEPRQDSPLSAWASASRFITAVDFAARLPAWRMLSSSPL